MKNLLAKEFTLAAHPTNYLFLLLSALLLIPNYPFYVTFFYTGLGLFFTCLTGRENHDIAFTAALPIAKTDVVNARFAFALLLEVAQILVAVPFAWLRSLYPAEVRSNVVGMDANAAFFGFSLLLLGVFNLVFFIRYYSAPQKVGSAFNRATVAFFVVMMVLEACAHAVPFVRDVLDTPWGEHVTPKLVVLGAGLAAFCLLTALAYSVSKKRFAKLDL